MIKKARRGWEENENTGEKMGRGYGEKRWTVEEGEEMGRNDDEKVGRGLRRRPDKMGRG
jgi:hypothetical protein